ncbi:hypothetical protein [uncultured Clostridium sp.]|uniref:hypothetical protein n=1 Tax=uncultured Clostridium sp. TaxID=59620 RepID=UPI002673A279|nr:hypothetical protein [uncultured Clostridium sp.]
MKARKRCPVKIRKYYIITLTILLLRNITLLLLSLIEKQEIMYFLKPMSMMDIITIPLLSMGALYIFLRNERMRFDYNFILMISMIGIYCFLISFYRLKSYIDAEFGYVVIFKDTMIPNLIYLIVMAMVTVISLINIDKPYSNTLGMKLLTFSTVVFVIEYILFLGGIKIFPYPFIGEISLLIVVLQSIDTFN